MRLTSPLLLAVAVGLVAFTPAPDASACGGCFHNDIQQMENTQVSGHRMIFSISPGQTTLWDQIQYVGAPSSFAWVLPIKGLVDVGISSDALFGNLDGDTKLTINSPLVSCPPPCFNSVGAGGASGSFDGGTDPGVVVTAQKVVGPYETVQLSASDPAALTDWLAAHGYVVPADVDPIIKAYVAEGLGFLALKLVPGLGIQSMRPVRVTSPGATPMLPLRMVAAGVGATTPISLWILGEGAYVPANFPSFVIPESKVVWDWTDMSSNYKQLRKDGFTSTQGKGWLIEAGEPMSMYQLQDQITNLASGDPTHSGYADDMGNGAPKAAADDLAVLFSGIAPASLWVTRLYAELPRAALATDLALSATILPAPINRNLTAQQSVGTPPMCPVVQPCDSTTTTGAGGATGGVGAGGGSGGVGGSGSPEVTARSGSCAVGDDVGGSGALGGMIAVLGLALARRRRV
jgi:MYXO-CTERM domain-containing protein